MDKITSTNPNLSIIIPVYNGESCLANTVHSVLRSSYHDLELLLVDDGSADSSLEVCKKLAAEDARIKVYHKTNGGIADARNYGLARAAGAYIGFCDQDDEIDPDMYGKMLARIASDHSQAAVCGCYKKQKNGKTVVYNQYTDDVFDGQQIREKLLLPMLFRGFAAYANDEISICPTIWNYIISRQLILEKDMRFLSFIHYEDDLIMVLQLFLQADRVSSLSDILYYWNTNLQSETHRSTGRYFHDLETRQDNFLNYVIQKLAESNNNPETINRYIYVQQCRNALLQLDNLAATDSCPVFCKIKKLRSCGSISYLRSAPDTVSAAKGFVRNSLILPLLRRGHIASAYCLNRLINFVRSYTGRHHMTERLERKMKETDRAKPA